MSDGMNRRKFLQSSLAASAAGSAALGADKSQAGQSSAKTTSETTGSPAGQGLPQGKIGDLTISRLILGGNLINHYTHSRDLRYVYDLTAHYNTPEKIMDTMALAEKHGMNTLVADPLGCIPTLQRYRRERGGKMQWIICPHAECKPGMEAYEKEARELVEAGADALYVWGVRGDQLVRDKKFDLLKHAVATAKSLGVPSGVGGHDLNVIKACEEHEVGADFYIKTFHHHKYPTAPKPEEIKGPYSEIPGYWCSDPDETAKVMNDVDKPWIAFKVMAAGAIPPQSAFPYVINHGADHILAGMFDFEVEEDVHVARKAIKNAKRNRAWCS